MKLGHIPLFVVDPLRSREFYETFLGFEVVAVQDDRFVWLKAGDLELLLRPGKNEAPAADYSRAPIALVLYTDDLERTARELRERGVSFRGTDGAECCLTFTDPDGHWFQLVSPE